MIKKGFILRFLILGLLLLVAACTPQGITGNAVFERPPVGPTGNVVLEEPNGTSVENVVSGESKAQGDSEKFGVSVSIVDNNSNGSLSTQQSNSSDMELATISGFLTLSKSGISISGMNPVIENIS